MRKKKRGRGRPPHEPTTRTRQKVRMLVNAGVGHREIAMMLDICPDTLYKHYRRDLDLAVVELNARVMTTFAKMATDGKHAQVTMRYAACRLGFSEKRAVEISGPESGPVRVAASVVERLTDDQLEALDAALLTVTGAAIRDEDPVPVDLDDTFDADPGDEE